MWHMSGVRYLLVVKSMFTLKFMSYYLFMNINDLRLMQNMCFLFLLQGEDIVAVLPWEEWWEFEVNKDDSDPHIALLPLHPDMRAKFNETAAWEYARSMEGKPYGYHNLIFSMDRHHRQELSTSLGCSCAITLLS